MSSNFSPDAPNTVNAAFYALQNAHNHNVAESATPFFAYDLCSNTGIAQGIARRSGRKEGPLFIEELCAGGIPDRWKIFAHTLSQYKINALLTDFPGLSIPDFSSIENKFPNIRLKYAEFDLLNSRPKSPEVLFDAVFTTYGFDSVWLKEDVRYAKRGDQWYQFKYRVKVLDDAPPDVKEELLSSMRNGSIPNCSPQDFRNYVHIEEAIEEINIDDVSYGEHIKKHFSSCDCAEVAFPGGMIRTIVDVLSSQVKEKGIFMVVDQGDVEEQDSLDGFRRFISRTGGAFFKAENAFLAKIILQDLFGFKVELIDFVQFLDQETNGLSGMEKLAQEEYRDDFRRMYAMIVSR